MLDKYGNILLNSSPLKKKPDNSDREAGAEALKASKAKLNEMMEEFDAFEFDNPYANAQNAFEGLENEYKDLDNVYKGAENVYEGKMENAFVGQKNAYEGMKNQFEDMENAFEDVKVNTQQAEFEAQQNAQQQANIMAQMQGAAGGSGIAALAQSMASQGQLQAQKASASIGAQEAQNEKLAADAEQKISMATATEGSKIAMTQAGEQSRLDTQEKAAEMDIQKTVLGADEALQAQRLGEASKLQLAEAQGETQRALAEAQGEMTVQEMKMGGEKWKTEQELGKLKTQMDIGMQQMGVSATRASQPKNKGFLGLGFRFSDERLKENINQIDKSKSGIPIYTFNYKNDNKTWVGAMAQDLIELGRQDAVAVMDNGYYAVNYNNIDINLKELKASPLKQLGNQGGQLDPKALETDRINEGQLASGMLILSEAQRRKNWEELQNVIVGMEPLPMQIRKAKDKILMRNQKTALGRKGIILEPGIKGVANSGKFIHSIFSQIKVWKAQMYEALKTSDKELEKEIEMKVATLKRISDGFRERTEQFYEDHFSPDSGLSKSVSKQQLSIAIQIYCTNPELVIVHAEREDVARGQVDMYGDLVLEDAYYAAVYDFTGQPVLCNILDGIKNLYWFDGMKAVEYVNELNELSEKATEAAKAKSVVKPPLGKINYKMDKIFGLNDGSAIIKQDHLVRMFAWDDDVLQDGSSFRRHLFEHPQIQNLNYGGFDYDKMKFNLPLGPGDKNHWADNIDDFDRIRLVDAICNVDNPFFDIKLLRTLVKEYCTYRLENAWWKGMGYEEGKLDVMRLKQKELTKQRFKSTMANTAKTGAKSFEFDGEVFDIPKDMQLDTDKPGKKEDSSKYES